MDLALAQAIVDLEIPSFGRNQKNKSDSCSCVFRPRRLLSSPAMLDHIGNRLAEVVLERCSSRAVVGLATSGIAWATLAADRAKVPLLYVRKQPEPETSNGMIEGIPPADRRVVLVDDLLFHGQSKRAAIHVLRERGFVVTDIVVVIDRELQRASDGPSLQSEFGLDVHSLICMTEIVDYMVERSAITPEQLADLVADYRAFERWYPPRFMRR